MDLNSFARQLEDIIGRPSSSRPFVCSGSPLACPVFLVGFNPATSSGADFWSFWTDDGFNLDAWFASYLEYRAATPLAPGKRCRPRISPSRRVIQWVREATNVSVLETNVFSTPSPNVGSLYRRDDKAFRFLLAAIKPKLLVIHGVSAQREVTQIETSAKMLNVPHFSRGWSRTAAAALAQRIDRELHDDITS